MNFQQAFVESGGPPVNNFVVHGQGVTIFSAPTRVAVNIVCPFARPIGQPSEEECQFVTAQMQSLLNYLFAEDILRQNQLANIPVMITTTHPNS